MVSGDDSHVYVQRFGADGSMRGSAPVQLDGVPSVGEDYGPEVSALGHGGEFVVTWYGRDNDSTSSNDFSIFVQKFAADGTTAPYPRVKLEAIGNTVGFDAVPSAVALGDGGEFLVAWEGSDAAGSNGVFLQRFNADGTTTGHAPAQLYAYPGFLDLVPRLATVGEAGEYVVAWANQSDVFVQRFKADGSTGTYPLQQFNHGANEEFPQVIEAGAAGEYVVAWWDTYGDNAVFVQHFNADGTTTGRPLVSLRATGVTNRTNAAPKLAALPDGGYVVSWHGVDETGDSSVYVQRFDATGSRAGATPVKLEAPNQPNYNDQAPVVTARREAAPVAAAAAV